MQFSSAMATSTTWGWKFCAYPLICNSRNTVELAKKFQAKVYCQFEISKFLIANGVPADLVVDMNKGGCVDIGGSFKASMVRVISFQPHSF